MPQKSFLEITQSILDMEKSPPLIQRPLRTARALLNDLCGFEASELLLQSHAEWPLSNQTIGESSHGVKARFCSSLGNIEHVIDDP
jgi:hypothetical protein